MSQWGFMLSGFKSSFRGRLSSPAGKGSHRPLEALWGTQVEAWRFPVRVCGHAFTSPCYYWENSVTRSEMLLAFALVFLAFLLFQWKRCSASVTSQSIDFCSRSHHLSLSRLLSLQLSFKSSASLLPNFSFSLLSQTSQKKCPLSSCSHLSFTHWPMYNLAFTPPLLELFAIFDTVYHSCFLVVSLCWLSSAV